MYHSISFFVYNKDTSTGGRNTWTSWRLIPSSRPYVAPPSQKTIYEEVPFSDGKLDFSEFGVSDVVFNNREGSWEFIAVNDMVDGYITGYSRADNGNKITLLSMQENKLTPYNSKTNSMRTLKEMNGSLLDWDQEYSTIMSYLQGEKRKIVLEDDPSFYYYGRVEVEEMSSDENYTTYSIKYDLDPYKKVRFSTGHCGDKELLWDSIDFDANLDILGLSGINVSWGDSFETGSFTTLRRKIWPQLTVSSSSGNTTNNIASVKIYENGSTKPNRTINFKAGTNNSTKINDFYLNGLTATELVISNIEDLSKRSAITFTLDYQLEGL